MDGRETVSTVLSTSLLQETNWKTENRQIIILQVSLSE
jgi:hypothetical protein